MMDDMAAKIASLEMRIRTVEAHVLSFGRCACGGPAPVYCSRPGTAGRVIQYRKCLACGDTWKTVVMRRKK